ncbi:succinate dehydrogenase, hydrophobic membrane anchor protein [Alphaproteobacteria bacterium]|nr:succinate dehydrogenase, hydrophobic membrane anchor protein [Alphaproteobacteria bacterium]
MNSNIDENFIKVEDMKTQKTHGVGHWKLQRISAVAMIPLVIWFTTSLMLTLMDGYEQSIEWLQSPFNATGLILLFGTLYFHAASGLQVVIEDYVHHEGLKIVSLILIKLSAILLGVLSILCVLKIYL